MPTPLGCDARGEEDGQGPAEAGRSGLERKQPSKATGRHLFFKELLAEVANKSAGRTVNAAALRQSVMKQHAHLYRGLSPAEQAQWQQQAAVEAAARQEDIQKDMQHLADALALAKARARQEFAKTGLMHGAEATRFDEADWTGLCALWHGPDLHPQQVHNLRAAAMTAPPAPPAAAQAVFAQTRIRGLEQAPPRPRDLTGFLLSATIVTICGELLLSALSSKEIWDLLSSLRLRAPSRHALYQ